MGPPTASRGGGGGGGGRGRGGGGRGGTGGGGRGGQASFSGRGGGGRGGGNSSAKPFSSNSGHKRPAPLPAGTEVTATYTKRPRKNEDLIKEITASWERMRRHDVPAAEKTRIAEDVLAKVKGSVSKLAMSHTTSRVLQAAAKAAGPRARADALEEISPDLLTLAKSSYGHFLAAKLISLASKEEVPALVKRFRGHVASLLRHPTGAPVVDELYSRASQRDRDAMTAELYSKEYSVFAPGNSSSSSSLSQIPASLAGALEARGGDARARREMLSRVAALLVPLLEKAAVDPPIVHRVLAEYLENASDAAGLEVAQLLCGGGSGAGAPLLRVVHTRDGARAACRALAAVGAKERKGAVKAIKGHAAAMARDEWGHAVLATALTVVDDTALLAKAVVAELVAGGKDEGEEGGEEEGGQQQQQQQLPLLRELCSHPHASRVFCQLLSPCDPRVLPPHTLALVKAASDRALGEDGMGAGGGGDDGGGGGGGKNDDGGEKDDGGNAAAPAADAADAAAAAASASSPSSAKSNLTSKKSAAKRRREILGSGSSPSSLGSALLRALAADAGALLRTPAGADLVVEAARGGGRDAILLQGAAGQGQGQGHAEGVSKLHEAIVSAIEKGLHAEGGKKKKKEKKDKKKEKEGEGEKKEEKKEDEEEEECLLTHFYASRALRRLVLCGGDSAGAFSSLLWERVLRGNCSRLCESHAAKVVAAVAVAGSAETREEIKGELRKCVAGGDVEAWAAGVLKPPPAKK